MCATHETNQSPFLFPNETGRVVTYKYVGVDGASRRETWQNGQDNILSIRYNEDFLEVVDDWSGDPLSSKVVSAIGIEGRQERLVSLLGDIVKSAPQGGDGVTRGAAALELMAHHSGSGNGHYGDNGNGNGHGNGAGMASGRLLEQQRGR